MRTQYPKLHDDDYEYIKHISETHTPEELEETVNNLKKEQYHDYKGNAGLIQVIERAIDIRKAKKSRDNFRNRIEGIENVFWSPFEKVDGAEEAAYLNLVDTYYEN